MEGIQVSTEVRGSQNQVSIIRVGGFIDTTTSSEVERALNSLLKQNRYNIIIDLGNVDYISSAGWGIFISEIKSIREHDGDLKLVRMIPDVYEIFELLEFHHILDVYDSVEEAVQKFEEDARKRVPVEAESGVAQVQASGVTQPAGAASKVKPGVATEATIPEQVESVLQGEEETGKRVEPEPFNMKSLESKIKHIVAQNPDLGAYKINKLLNTAEYNYSKVGWFTVRSILSQLGLNSRKKRRKFAQEVARSAV
ncbi:MAG: hypothetical protein Kow0042_23450 [Calditrichia bacterium]